MRVVKRRTATKGTPWGTRVSRECKVCEKTFQTRPADRRTRCDKCRSLGLWKKKRVCPHCRVPFVPKRSDQKFCDGACARANRRKPKQTFTCEQCGKKFRPKKQWRECYRFCGPACSSRKRPDVRRGGPRKACKVPWRVCKVCGKRFVGRRHGSAHCRMCRSTTCCECGQDLRRPAGQRRRCKTCGSRERRRVRRARAREALVERFDSVEIFERDGWRCQICGKKVRRKAPKFHPLSPVLDHIVSFSNGGKHERKNVQCAHFRCNNERNARDEGKQLLML